jgi:hypothetical protein
MTAETPYWPSAFRRSKRSDRPNPRAEQQHQLAIDRVRILGQRSCALRRRSRMRPAARLRPPLPGFTCRPASALSPGTCPWFEAEEAVPQTRSSSSVGLACARLSRDLVAASVMRDDDARGGTGAPTRLADVPVQGPHANRMAAMEVALPQPISCRPTACRLLEGRLTLRPAPRSANGAPDMDRTVARALTSPRPAGREAVRP